HKKAKWQEKYGSMTAEAALLAQTKLWYGEGARKASPAYQHFHPPVLLVQSNKSMYKFVCKKNPSLSICRAPYEDSTGNFNTHIKVCDPEQKGTIATFAAGCTYDAAKFH
ncbi:hypothetical protein MPER_07676, partial [Moniliophthora perniciosa FA553]